MRPATAWRLSRSRRWLPATILGLGLLGLASGYSLDTAEHLLQASGVVGPLAFIALGTLLMCLFVPKTLVSLAAGGLFGVVQGCWVLSVTAVVAACVNYHIGRWSLHHDALFSSEDQAAGSLEDANRAATVRGRLLRRIATTANQAGLGFHLLVRLSPIPTTVISYAMGAASARQTPYIAAAIIATIPQWLWVYCAASATEGTFSAAKWLSVGCSATAAIVLSVWVPRQLFRARDV